MLSLISRSFAFRNPVEPFDIFSSYPEYHGYKTGSSIIVKEILNIMRILT